MSAPKPKWDLETVLRWMRTGHFDMEAARVWLISSRDEWESDRAEIAKLKKERDDAVEELRHYLLAKAEEK